MQYLAGWPDEALWDRLVTGWLDDAGITRMRLPEGLRVRDTADRRFVFNYGLTKASFEGAEIEPAGVHWTPLP